MMPLRGDNNAQVCCWPTETIKQNKVLLAPITACSIKITKQTTPYLSSTKKYRRKTIKAGWNNDFK